MVESRAFKGFFFFFLEESTFEPADDALLFVLTPFDTRGQRSGRGSSGGCFRWVNSKSVPATYLLFTGQRSPRRSDFSPLISSHQQMVLDL